MTEATSMVLVTIMLYLWTREMLLDFALWKMWNNKRILNILNDAQVNTQLCYQLLQTKEATT